MTLPHSEPRPGRARTTGFALLAALAALSAVPGTAPAADASAGKAVFKKCAACHKLEAGKHGVGPSLHGIIGRKAGTAEGFRRYSKALKEADFVWTRERLDRWLTKPKKMIPGTRMPFPGLPDPEDRENVIEYLGQSGK